MDSREFRLLESIARSLERIAVADELRNELLVADSEKRDRAIEQDRAARREEREAMIHAFAADEAAVRDPGYPYGEFDARKWAAEFKHLHPDADEELLVGWFANAIMTGHDAGYAAARREWATDAG